MVAFVASYLRPSLLLVFLVSGCFVSINDFDPTPNDSNSTDGLGGDAPRATGGAKDDDDEPLEKTGGSAPGGSNGTDPDPDPATLKNCGDGKLDDDDGEICDDGDLNGTGPQICDEGCLAVQSCGDGSTQGTELCDDGKNNGKDGNCDLRCGLPWFVDAEGTDGGDGNSWATAFNKLDTAVSAANANGGGELWVKAGSYEGDTYFRAPKPAVTLAQNVRLYGGFAGTETKRNQRDWKTNETYLTKGSHNVVLASHTVVDGFFVTAGDASDDYENAGGIPFDERGGGIFGENVTNVTLRNLVVRGNYAFLGGGGLQLIESAAIVRDVLFDANSTGPSGPAGAEIRGGNVEFHDTRFVRHQGGLDSSGMSVHDAVFIMENTDFYENSGPFGPPLYLSNISGTAQITNCLFAHNLGPADEMDSANAIHVGDNSKVIVTNVSFIENDEGGTPLQPDVRAGSGTEVYNAFVYHLWPIGSYVGVTPEDSCSETYGPSSKAPIEADRDMDGFNEYYLHPLGSCTDSGDNTAADLAGLEWRELTTRDTDCLDVGRIDGGRHYEPLSSTAGPCTN